MSERRRRRDQPGELGARDAVETRRVEDEDVAGIRADVELVAERVVREGRRPGDRFLVDEPPVEQVVGAAPCP